MQFLRRILNSKAHSLLALALAAGVAWRLELELRGGWYSLAWIRYQHWTVPLGVIGFVAWVMRFTRVRQPGLFAASILGFGLLNCLVVEFLMKLVFGRFVTMSWFPGNPVSDQVLAFLFSDWALSILWMAFPLIFCGICRLFGVPVKILPALSSAILFLASWSLATLLYGVFGQYGSSVVHALKSGYVIPFLVVSLGLPILLLPTTPSAEPERY